MSSTYKKYLDDIMNKITIGSKYNVMLIRHYHAFNFIDKEKLIDINEKGNFNCVFYTFSDGKMENPFEPFLSWIKEMIEKNGLDIDNFLEEMNVYSMHKMIFKSYFSSGICKRYEHFIDHSYAFERGKIYDTIINMINYFSKLKPVLFVFDKLHCIELSSLKLLKRIIEEDNGVFILAGYNEIYPVIGYKQYEWNTLIDLLEEKEYIIDFEEDNEDLALKNEDVEKSETWKLKESEIENVIIKINNKEKFLAFDESAYFLNVIYDQINFEKLALDEEYVFLIYEMYINVLSILAKFKHKSNANTLNDVFHICEKMQTICSNSKNLMYKFIYSYNLARVYLHNGQQNNCIHYTKEAIKIAKKMQDEDFIVKSNICNICGLSDEEIKDYSVIQQIYAEVMLLKANSEFSLYSPDKKNVPTELIDKLYQYKLYDHLAEALNCSCEREKEIFESIDKINERAPMLVEAIKIGKTVGNNAFLRSLYRVNIMRASNAGYYDTATYFCEKVLEVIGDDEMQAAYTFLGMGYNCCTAERYEQAHDYFCRAMITCYKYHDVNHIAEIMYNMAINAICAENFEVAIQYINHAIKIMDKMSIVKLFACGMVKLNALKVLCLFELKRSYLCSYEFKKISRNINFQYLEDKFNKYLEESYFYYYIKGLIDMDKKDYNSALQNFAEAEMLMEQMEGLKFFNYVPFMKHKIITLKQLGRSNEVNTSINNVNKLCDEYGYVDKKERFLAWLKEETVDNKIIDFSLKGITMDEIFSVVEMEKNKKIVKEKKNEDEFLTKWQNIMSNPGNTINDLIDKGLNSFSYNYNVDGLIMISYHNNNVSAITKNVEYVMPNSSIRILWDFFDKTNRNAFFMNANSKNYDEYLSILELFRDDKIFSLVGVPFRVSNSLQYVFYAFNTIRSRALSLGSGAMNIMKEDELPVYVRLFRQFVDTIGSMKKSEQIVQMNEKLKYYAHTDLLTGLLNRKGMEQKLTEVFEDGKNINISNSVADMGRRVLNSKYRFYTVIYIDMDNFKYYNDTFGHEIGDLVLKKFSDILRKICKGSGIAVRYGGDEFVLIFRDLDRNKIIEIADEVYKCIDEENAFIDYISEELNMLISIEEKNRISCSMGIAGFKVLADEGMSAFKHAIDNADKALYHVKKTTKGTYSFYNR